MVEIQRIKFWPQISWQTGRPCGSQKGASPVLSHLYSGASELMHSTSVTASGEVSKEARVKVNIVEETEVAVELVPVAPKGCSLFAGDGSWLAWEAMACTPLSRCVIDVSYGPSKLSLAEKVSLSFPPLSSFDFQAYTIHRESRQVEQKKKRTFRKFTYRGVDLDQLLDLSYEQLVQLYSARQRRRLSRGLPRKQHSLFKRLRKAKKEAPPMEKPEVVKTPSRHDHPPEMVGSMGGVYNGKTFNQVEIKPETIGHYLGEFSITYKPVKHGSGIGATHSSCFIPLQ
ncbi:uncharacterized protein LOC122755125 [Dromiciops gliroides]|uniref:uncharacterized protein LOC122755125 n=1 Tax=Dromiciops gliroides TaxID=33562 RepID=UPI001CC77CE6|nr:uncharacterized protein LOC122755125 [Dromiciops gliroides]